MGEEKAKRPKWKTLLAMLFIVWTICLFAVGISEKSATPVYLELFLLLEQFFIFKEIYSGRDGSEEKRSGNKTAY